MAWSEKHGKMWRVRYFKDDGTLGSVPGFPNKSSADNYADTLETDQRRGSWIDPAAGRITVAEWADDWLDALDLSRNTETQYRSLATNHILPRWGETSLTDITGLAVAAWRKQLSARCAPATITTIVKVLSMMLADAADDKLIAANPIRPRRRGKRHRAKPRERIWATQQQALCVADNAAALVGPWAGTLMITAAWTGARWGELTGLQRHNTHLDDACIVIDPDIGALHEINGHFELGPPKTAESARTITLPPFLIPLLRRHLDNHDHNHVFVTAEGEYLRRSNFSRRAMRPAADGNLKRTAPPARIEPVQPGLTFHGFRHSHKTWMIADGVPEIAQAARLGHTLEDKMQKVYSHIAAEVEHRLITGLQDRWDKAVADSATPEPHTRWRRP
ncbi:tyrosine-type recombinase/integrase [Lentzea sp. BCCO 10_0798]|uniref:Tyrosine-type recombinase/integrase n=1 Tax=Lentzea kristufekii TaxID=3095430 RepID=A0ABU4TZK1_9PSEU|nr:tyrosine-type recombinase/integrase [Lentzea sp. BCCO 10_0798]MDX8053754.1 tyrosine-type recombinase/integrase [Lentzea sp. BCCO 10_0798]